MKKFSLSNLMTSDRMIRLLSFFIDAVIIFMLASLCFSLFGAPDFASVQTALSHSNAVRGTPEEQEAARLVNETFGRAYISLLIIIFGYESLMGIIFKGATLGKLICGLKIVPNKHTGDETKGFKSIAAYTARLLIRGAVRVLFIYLFSGIPFLISTLTIFADAECRSGIDYFAGTKVIRLARRGSTNRLEASLPSKPE